MHLPRIAVAIDDDDPVGGNLGDLLVGLGDGALELEPLGLETILARRASEADLRIDPQQDGQVGPEPFGRGV